MATVLVVDDQAVNRDLVRTILGYAGHDVIEAASGDEALDRVRVSVPDLVITDILMPGVDGCELVRELRADPATSAVPVVFCTANYLEAEIGPIASAYGVSHVLTKGFEPNELLAAVSEILTSHVTIEPGAPDDEVVREQLRTVNTKLLDKVRSMEVQEEELRRSEERFRQMAECATVGMALGDAEGNAWYVNARLVEILAAEPDELLGAGWRSRLNLHDLRAQEWTTGQPLRVRRPFADRDGSIRWLSVTVSLALDADGVPFGTLAAVDDVTVVVDAEARQQELDARIRVGERLESLGRLAGGVAHDFNNLLTAILAFTQFAETAIGDGVEQGLVDEALGDQVLGYLARVLGAGNRAANLTARLLTFGRPDLARPEILDVNMVVAEVTDLLVRTIGADIDMVSELGADLWPVHVDASQLSQVVLNLAVNARDAMPDGGSLTIHTANLTAEATAGDPAELWRPAGRAAANLPAGRYVHLGVADTGHGMSAEVLARAFEPFFTTKPAGEGTGLGLATVHSIVRQAGGRIIIDTAPGRGTTINVYFPATDEDMGVTTSGEHADPDAGGHETILVVDDEATICDIAEHILTAAGYRTVIATSGRAAVAIAESREIDLLLTDLVMPHMSGQELAATITARHPGTRVLFMSGYAGERRDGQDALPAGATILAKPFTEATLRRAVRAALDAEPARP